MVEEEEDSEKHSQVKEAEEVAERRVPVNTKMEAGNKRQVT